MKARKLIVAGVSAGVLAGGAAGFLLTVPGGAGASPSAVVRVAGTDSDGDATLSPQHHGGPHLGPEERAAKFEAVLQGLVDSGEITTAQRDAIVSALEAARPNSADGGHVEGAGGRHGGRLGKALDTAATAIGVTVDELKTALQSGQSIADVATANGVDPQAVIDALVADATADLTQRFTDMVNGVRPADAPTDAPAGDPAN